MRKLDLYIESVTGESEMVTDFELKRNESISGDRTITVSVTKTERNQHAYNLIKNENSFRYDNEFYIIKQHRERIVGNTVKLECTAVHMFFDELINTYVYDTISGTKNIYELLDFVLDGLPYYAVVDDWTEPFESITVENFGDDNALALFRSLMNRFGAEFEVSYYYLFVTKQIGYETEMAIRYKMNVKDPQKEIDTSSLATYIRGYGKQNEDGSYVAYQEYTSPLADVYGIKHAKPVRDERFTNNASLLEEMKRRLHDSIDITLSLTYIQLKELGISGDIYKGDYLWCILEPFDIDIKVRVVDVEDYSNPYKSPVFTIGTISKKATDVMADFNTTKKTVEKVVNIETNTIRQQALSTETNYVVDAIERTFGQIDYTDDVSVSDPANFMRRVGLRKGGIYKTTDGITRTYIITPDGINPSEIVVGPHTQFAPGYNPTEIEIPEVPKATETQDGLMPKEDKTKLNQIYTQTGQVYDLSIFMQKINDLETSNTDLQDQIDGLLTRIDDLEQRIGALEGGVE